MSEQTGQQPTADTHDMSWVLERLKQEKGVLHAVLLSSEGLVLAATESLKREVAERTAAQASSLFSLGKGVSEFADLQETPPRKIIIDLPGRTILVFSAGHRTALAVAVGAEMTSSEVVVVTGATIKAINGLREALSARERKAYGAGSASS
jgi:predicted regulator of Ras-like GTPase activity (Roadblock/LC7/MglB family)